MKFRFVVLSVIFVSVVLFATSVKSPRTDEDWNNETAVADILHFFGEPYPSHRPAERNEDLIEKGRQIITIGRTTGPDGKLTKIQSRHFACTSCHNIAIEDPDLRYCNPDTRLDYVIENNLPFLQGTTLYGTVNKVSWYNDDYEKKYGDLVKPARDSLEGAIHLCATVCSQGRDFTDWEMDAVLAYFWSLELKMGDLSFTDKDWEDLRNARKYKSNPAEIISWIKTFYLQGSPATFLDVPEDKGAGYEVPRPGDAENGKKIYVNSCMKCHDRHGPSKYLKLDTDPLSLALLKNKITSSGHLSLYEIIRHGTYADNGHRAYMPHFTAERMSNQQVEDLRAFVEQ